MNSINESFVEPLGFGELETSKKDLYTPPKPMQTEVKSVFLENISGADRIINMTFRINNEVRNWITNMTLLSNCKLELLGVVPIGLKYLDAIEGSADINSGVKYSIFGRVQIQ